MHNLKIEFSKFTVVGALNFVFTFILFFLLVKILHVNYLFSLIAVSLLGMILTYSLNHVWVFKPEEQLSFKGRLYKYVFAGLVSIGLNTLTLAYIVENTGFDPFYVQTALIPLIVVFNFSTAKFWSLKPASFHSETRQKPSHYQWLKQMKFQLPLVSLLAFACILWRFAPITPSVFFGDNLLYLLAFKAESCGTKFSQLLTVVCQDKFRPVAAGFILLLFNLFDTSMPYYQLVNRLLQTLSAVIFYLIAYRFSQGRIAVALALTLAVATSRFGAYQVTQVIGPVEGLALPMFLAIIYLIQSTDAQPKSAWQNGGLMIILAFLVIHNHERYIVIAPWLAAVFIIFPHFRQLSVKRLSALLSASIALPIFYIGYKNLILSTPFLVGTERERPKFDFQIIFTHLRQAMHSIFGFNEGPEYLAGVNLASLPWFPSWLLASLILGMFLLSAALGVRNVIVNKASFSSSVWLALRWPVALFILALILLIPPIATTRLEQRWLFAPFILMLLIGAWAVGQQSQRSRVPIWLLLIFLATASISLDSLLLKHFNQIFFVYSSRYAEMVKRDIVDKDPKSSAPLKLLAHPEHCQWSLFGGSFFQIYGGHSRPLECISLNTGAIKDDRQDTQIFAETTPGHLTDVTADWHAKSLAQNHPVLYDFITEFPQGHINDPVHVDTPSGKGALILPWESRLGAENSLTLISGFSYRFDNVRIEPNTHLVFGLSMVYPAKEAMKASVLIDDHQSASQQVLFSQEVIPPKADQKLQFQSISVAIDAYAGKSVTITFVAQPTGNDISSQWLAFSNPKLLLLTH